MAINYPKFDNKIQSKIDNARMRQSKTRPGVVMKFDPITNSADVILEDQYSGEIGNILSGVPCPTLPGIQTVAPNPGTRCLVGFRDDNERFAYIISLFEEGTLDSNYMYNYTVNTGVPKFMSR